MLGLGLVLELFVLCRGLGVTCAIVKRLRPGGPRVRLCVLRAPALRTIAKRRETGHEHPPQSAESCHWATQRLLSIMDLSCIYLDD